VSARISGADPGDRVGGDRRDPGAAKIASRSRRSHAERRMTTASPAQLYATLVGAALVIAGIIGFLYDSSFATGDGLAPTPFSACSPSTRGTTWSTS
jgi:hypothetical protein